MRAHEIIRSVLDLIDKIENPQEPVVALVDPVAEPSYDDESRRFKQILDLLSSDGQMYDNSPAEAVSNIEAVTTDAGGGWNGPKHPSDIRANSVSMYPNFQANKE